MQYVVPGPVSMRYPAPPGTGPAAPRPPSFIPWKAHAVTALAAVVALAVVTVVTGWFASRQPGRWLVDHPDERSLHHRPTSRAGGVAILAGISAGLAILALIEPPAPGSGWILAGAIVIACVSFADDVQRVFPIIRIACHLAAAGCVVLAGLSTERIDLPGATFRLGPVVGTAFTILFVAWFVNLYNFMDGMDGFAGGMTVVGFTALAALCAGQGAPALAAASLVVAAGALGFLAFNFPPARIFMGDLGSTLLGYASAVTMLSAQRSASVPLWIPCLAFSPFIVDATATLARQIIAGERPWHAHCGHFYQRLVRLGWGHRKTVVLGYGLMLACACSAAAAFRLPSGVQWALLGAWVAAYVVLMHRITRLERGGNA